jgi:hypothetical protein
VYDDSTEQTWQRTVWVGLAALLSSAVVIGVAVGVMAVGASKVAGVGRSSAGPDAPESLYMPQYTKTPLVDEPPIAEGAAPAAPHVSAVPLDPTNGPTSAVGEITLYANPTQVVSGEKIDLNGVYLDGEGVSLQVQRQDGGAWVDFPTKASVRNGAFDTFVYTGRFGENVFRVFDPTTGRSSNSVTVTVG